MSVVKIIAFGVSMLIVLSVAETVDADLPVRPPRPASFKSDADVKEYVQKLKAFLDKGGNRYGKRNTFPLINQEDIDQSNEESIEQPIYKEYVQPAVQHPQHRYYPEWMKVISPPSKRMWY